MELSRARYTVIAHACTSARRRALPSWTARVCGALLLGGVALSGCTSSTQQRARARQNEEAAAHWRRHAVEGHAGSATVPETHVPRVRCYDGSPSIGSCTSQGPHAGCCANQGGVYRDSWGNVVLQ